MSKKVQKLQDKLNTALRKQKFDKAFGFYEDLAKLEPAEARWPHRKGDLLKRLGKPGAVVAYARAVDLYSKQGFIARAAALAKLVLQLDASRIDVLEMVDPEAARRLREEVIQTTSVARASRIPAPSAATAVPPTAASSTPEPIAVPTASVEPAVTPDTFKEKEETDTLFLDESSEMMPAPSEVFEPAPQTSSRLGVFEGAPERGEATLAAFPTFDDNPKEASPPAPPAAAAPPPPPPPPIPRGFRDNAVELELVEDIGDDEVRFVDSEEGEGRAEVFELDASEVELVASDEEEAPNAFDSERPDSMELAKMPAMPLFADVSEDALRAIIINAEIVELAPGEKLITRGDESDALFILTDGDADVVIPGIEKAIRVVEGSLVGESCLLSNAKRSADVVAVRKLQALKLTHAAVLGLTERYPEVEDVLFEVLSRRLVSNLLQTSPMFVPFDPETKKQLSAMFEVRRAKAGTKLLDSGKRSDGLYIPLAGRLEADISDEKITVPNGELVGQRSLISSEPSDVTVAAATEVILLRLPAVRFAELAALYPSALAYLSELDDSQMSNVPALAN